MDTPDANGTMDSELTNLRLGVYGGLGAAQAFFVLLQSVAMALGTLIAAMSLHSHLLYRVFRAPMAFFDTTPLGRILNRFSKDIDVVDVYIPLCLRIFLWTLSSVIGTLVVIVYSTWEFVFVIIPLGIIYYFVQRFYVATSRQLKRVESVRRSPIFSHFSETLNGASSIRAYGKENEFIRLSDDKVNANQIVLYPTIISNRWMGICLEFIGALIVLSAAIFAILFRDKVDAGKVGLSVSYSLSVTMSLNYLVRMTCDLETQVVSVERIIEYCRIAVEAPWNIESEKPYNSWPDTGRLQLENYATRYRPGLDLVLKGVDCEVQPSEKVGIVGRTGAGKSSLTLALFRLIEPSAGRIVIDGIDIFRIGLHDLRSKLTIIPQDPVLFSGTIRMNLDPFNHYVDRELWTALEQAHLKDFVKEQPDQLDHICTEGGENLSVGQRQLVCLARALLRKTKLLILDEATAAVDLETDELIQNTIRQEFAECTVLTIAHRINTVMDYDRILVLDNGRVKEFDSPHNLLRNTSGIFFSLSKQAGLV